MKAEIAALRSNRSVVLAVVVAAVAVTLLALIAIAKLLGWVPSRPAASTPMSVAAPANKVAGSAPDLGLGPGETVVVPADTSGRPAPMMPHYTSPAPPAPAPAAAAAEPPKAAAQPAPPAAKPERKPRAPRAEPRPPSFVRGDPHPTSPTDTWPNPGACAHCGRVVATTTWPDMAEVRVQFEDGSTRTLRSPSPSPWHVGDRVRMERGRLVRD